MPIQEGCLSTELSTGRLLAVGLSQLEKLTVTQEKYYVGTYWNSYILSLPNLSAQWIVKWAYPILSWGGSSTGFVRMLLENYWRIQFLSSRLASSFSSMRACACWVVQWGLTFCNPMDYSPPPLSMGLSRQEYRNRLPFPSPGDIPDPGMQPHLLLGRWILYH